MKGKTKAIIGIIAGLIIVIVIAVAVFGGYMYYSYSSKNETALKNGETFGRTSDQAACIDESVRQFAAFKENSFLIRIEQTHIGHFTRGCLNTALETPKFCDDVPKDANFPDRLKWSISKCDSVGLNHDGPCNEIFKEKLKMCTTKKPKTVRYPDK